MEIREIVRQLRAGESIHAIARNTGLHRKTIRRYKRWAERAELLSGAEFSGRRLLDQELSMLSLQLVQNSLIFVNTLLLQRALANPSWFNRMTTDDWRGLTPLFYAHINPYGTFKLDMDRRIPIESAA